MSSPLKRSAAAVLAITAWAALGAVPAHAAAQASSSPATQERVDPATLRHVTEATEVVKRMAAEPRMRTLLRDARGVFVVPQYGRAAIGLGASGGAGLLLVKKADGKWSDPAFFNVGSVGVGLQIGAQTGELVFVLNNEKAVDEFRKKHNFALSADAGLTVVNWNRMAQGTGGTGDIVVWSATRGLFGNAASVNVMDVLYNERATASYYGQRVNVDQIVDGKVTSAQAEPLKTALASAGS